ncbi:MAG: 4-hydroxythreonine-4-phosphate dehydrogenase PdxA [Ilumatobacteraceae bacterium]|nr:4-hydroxythreonine-4-phosphate dehydrogenase PdxA [Ilumatobacteraceae bacterium]
MTTERVPMAITMGDPSGVGPEIVLRSFAAGDLDDDVVVYGDAAILRHGATLLGLDVELHVVNDGHDVHDGDRDDRSPGRRPRALQVVDLGLLAAGDHAPGALDRRAGAAARQYVVRATEDALAGRVAGVVTMPMNKEATQLTDPAFVGHTELIAQLCGVPRVTMMLTAALADGSSLAVTHVSTHCSLREAIERVRPARVLDVIEMTDATLRRFLPRPRIAVCGLNPHAGEHGLFGVEDAEQIAPAIAQAQAAAIDASGPHPADTVFHQAVHRHRYDAIVCMYHDQGHGPMKLLAFDTGVNVTLGLPIIRTSVDHGTAFDIAWQGIAFTDSLRHALNYAWKLAGRVEAGAR